ncbi:unnamed protein product, partial [Nesidiocoris tenuis]
MEDQEEIKMEDQPEIKIYEGVEFETVIEIDGEIEMEKESTEFGEDIVIESKIEEIDQEESQGTTKQQIFGKTTLFDREISENGTGDYQHDTNDGANNSDKTSYTDPIIIHSRKSSFKHHTFEIDHQQHTIEDRKFHEVDLLELEHTNFTTHATRIYAHKRRK